MEGFRFWLTSDFFAHTNFHNVGLSVYLLDAFSFIVGCRGVCAVRGSLCPILGALKVDKAGKSHCPLFGFECRILLGI